MRSLCYLFYAFIIIAFFGCAFAESPSSESGSSPQAFYEKQRATEKRSTRFIFVPGVLGSAISECESVSDANSCKQIWGTADALRDTTVDLTYKPNAIYKTKIIENFLMTEVYGNLLDFFEKLTVYESRIHIFSYDWRLANHSNAELLAGFICEVSLEHPDADLAIVAHSMGGLITKDYLSNHLKKPCGARKPPPITKIAFIATPHLGSAKSIMALATGYSAYFESASWPFSFLASLEKERVFGTLNKSGPAFNSPYELLPVTSSDFCRSQIPQLDRLPPPFVVLPEQKAVNIYDDRMWHRFRLTEKLAVYGMSQPWIEGNIARLLKNGEQFSCDWARYNPTREHLLVIYFYGRGRSEDTIGTVSVTPKKNAPADLSISTWSFGDGTVPIFSASDFANSATSQLIEVPADHLTIMQHSKVRDVLREWARTASGAFKKTSLELAPLPLDVEKWLSPDFRATLALNGGLLEKGTAVPLKAWGAEEIGDEINGENVLPKLTRALLSGNDLDAYSISARYAYHIGSYSEAKKAASRIVYSLDSKQIRLPPTAWRWPDYRYVSSVAILGWAALRLGDWSIAESSFEALRQSGSHVAAEIARDGLQASVESKAKGMFVETFDWESRLLSEYAEEINTPQASTGGTELTVEVSGLRNYKGRIVLMLWADSEYNSAAFPDPTLVQFRDERARDVPCDFAQAPVCRRTIENIQNLTVSYKFRDIPRGDYAVFVFHDENNNGALDAGLFHRPLEGRGYSQVLPEDLNPIAAKITFHRARFALPASKTIVIGLRYPPRL